MKKTVCVLVTIGLLLGTTVAAADPGSPTPTRLTAVTATLRQFFPDTGLAEKVRLKMSPQPASIDSTVTDTDLAALTGTLTASSSGISSLAGLSYLKGLTSLNLSSNSLSSIPSSAFATMENLTVLNLGGNQLTTLPVDVFAANSKLTTLSLQDNAISSLPDGIFDPLPNLTGLNLYSNQLTTLPAGIFKAQTKLTTLQIYNNQLTTLPSGVFANLLALQYLFLYNNNLSSLPAGIFDSMTLLRTLDLHANHFTGFNPGVFDSLVALTTLYLQENPLGYVSASLLDQNSQLTAFNVDSSAILDGEPAPGAMTATRAVTHTGTVAISGTATFGHTLTTSFTGWESGSGGSYQWYRSAQAKTAADYQPIPGATKSSYMLQGADVDHYILVQVVGQKTGKLGRSARSAPKEIAGVAFNQTPAPTISGTVAAGLVLTAVEGTWEPAPDYFTYQWFRDGVAIPGATSKTYQLLSADYQHAITVVVAGYKDGYYTVAAPVLVATAPVASGKFTATPTPTISGTAPVGKTLSVKTGTWKPVTPTFNVQWKRNGKAIKGATKLTYTLKAADKGKKITVSVTTTSAGFPKVTKTSKSKKIAAGKITAQKLVYSGTAKVGQTLKVTTKKWKPSGVKLKYQWYRSGKKISGAVKSTYKITSKDAGKKISVKVTGTKAGYKTVTKSTSSKTVPKPKKKSSSGGSTSNNTTPKDNCKIVGGKEYCT
ncbi:MAG: leucine-rich repeat domain-containing protein [Propionibacteriaceae bacterium]|jgi:hypothetical protein|nr:leucine-rich repeat domain-containing protein [Propionibacteriaceae bacterium]